MRVVDFGVRSRGAINPATPSWVPAAGEVATLTVANGGLANNFRDVVAPYYDAFYSVGIWNDYSAPTPNPYWGTYGGNVAFGGGHASTNDNSVIVEEFGYSQITCKRVTDPTAWAGTGTDSTTKTNNSTANYNGQLDLTYGESTIDDQPASTHTYACGVIIPPANGGAACGTFFRPIGGGPNYANSTTTQGAHHLPLTDTSGPFTWARTTNNTSGSAVNTPQFTAYDPDLNRTYYQTENNGQKIRWFDHSAGTYNASTGAAGFPVDSDASTGGVLLYISSRRLLLHAFVKGGEVVWRYADVSGSNPTLGGTATLSASMPAGTGWSAADWVSDISRIVVGGLNQSGSLDTAAVYELEIPATLTDTWTVTRRAFSTGTIPWAARDVFRKWAYHPHCKSFIYRVSATRSPNNDTVYVYRPEGV